MSQQMLREAVLRNVQQKCRWTGPIEFLGDKRLDELGIDSMGVLTLLATLEAEIGLDFDRMTQLSPPVTVEDVISLAFNLHGAVNGRLDHDGMNP